MSDSASILAHGDLKEIVHAIVDRHQPRKVILFGSQAYGTPEAGSDIDLLVVVDNPPATADWPEASYALRQQTSFPVQLVFMSTEEFNETKDVVGGVAYPAHRWGEELYDAQS